MKNKLIWMLTITALLISACDSKKTESSEADDKESATEEASTELLGADAEVLEGMNVYFVNIEDGSTITSPLTVEMGVNGMEVEPAGELSKYKGHHHLIIDGEFEPKGMVVPADTTHIHFGKGQTSTEVKLSPGAHTLTLQFADGFHRSYGEKMSAQVSITVQ